MKRLFESMKTYFRQYSQYIKIVVFVFFSIVLYQRIVTKAPYPTGDGPEYLLMTEALYNHGTPDVRLEDVISFKAESEKIKKWEDVHKYEFFNEMISFFSGEYQGHGFFYAGNKKRYSFHFFFYSLANVPVRALVGLSHGDPMITYQITNGLLILGTCFLLLFYNKGPFKGTVYLAIVFFFSSIFWYSNWVHTEPMTTCLVAIAMFLFFNKRYYIAMILMALATLQNQPLVLLYGLLSLIISIEMKFKIRVLSTLFFIGLICLLPPLFYFYHYGTFSMIKAAGHLDASEATFTRIWGFFFDLDQGAILAIPLLLIAYILLILKGWINIARRKTTIEFHYLIPLALFAIIFTVASMKNWNHGQAIVSRYVTWITAVMIIHTMYILSQRNDYAKTYWIVGIIAISQILSILYFERNNQYDWSGHHHKAHTAYILNRWPGIYNPDPRIFISRTTNDVGELPTLSPVIYWDDSLRFKKMIVHKEKLDVLSRFGIVQTQIDSIKQHGNFIINWIYFNEGEMNLDVRYEMFEVDRKRKEIRRTIFRTPEWRKNIEEKAQKFKIPVDSMVELDIEYILKND